MKWVWLQKDVGSDKNPTNEKMLSGVAVFFLDDIVHFWTFLPQQKYLELTI